MTTALKEIHIENSKKRDASVRFVSLIREKDPKLAYKGKTIKNSRLLISSDETSEDSLINKHKSKLAESILKEDVDVDVEYAGKFIGDIDKILFRSLLLPQAKKTLSPIEALQIFINSFKESSLKNLPIGPFA